MKSKTVLILQILLITIINFYIWLVFGWHLNILFALIEILYLLRISEIESRITKIVKIMTDFHDVEHIILSLIKDLFGKKSD